jgi:hypothetical protein
MEEHQAGMCMICGHVRFEGIRILAAFLCDDCESELVATDVQDKKYPFFVHRLRQLSYKKDA